MNAFASFCTRTAFGLQAKLGTPRLSILIFHRVHASTDPLFPGEPDAARFDALLGFVGANFQVLTLGRAAAALAADALPARALVITFDDGYADNAEVALPLLQRHGLAASFFVSTGFLDGGRMWNDSVIECLRACTLSEVDLSAFNLGSLPVANAAQRRAAIDALLPKIKYLTLEARELAIAKLQAVTGVTTLPSTLMMRSQQVRDLHNAGMEIGGHTVNHPILAAIEPEQARHELAQGKQTLEGILDAPVDVLAYPNGKPHRDYDARHVVMARELGFRAAVSTAAGAAQAGDDLFQLPRFTPWDTSLARWGARMWLNQRNGRFDRA